MWPFSNLIQHHPTSCNMLLQGDQTRVTRCAQQLMLQDVALKCYVGLAGPLFSDGTRWLGGCSIWDHLKFWPAMLYSSNCKWNCIFSARCWFHVCYLKPRLNDQTFSSNIVFVAHNVGWLNEQTIFDQTLNKVSPHNAFYVLPLTFCSDVTQNRYLIGCFFPLGFALFPEVAKRSNICSWSKMLDENVWSTSNMGSHLYAMLRKAAKRSNMLSQHDVERKCLIV